MRILRKLDVFFRFSPVFGVLYAGASYMRNSKNCHSNYTYMDNIRHIQLDKFAFFVTGNY